jgi:hypothetical protein
MQVAAAPLADERTELLSSGSSSSIDTSSISTSSENGDGDSSSNSGEVLSETPLGQISYRGLTISPMSAAYLEQLKKEDAQYSTPKALPRREPDSPADPASPGLSMSHLEKWTERSETLIILDWDDTAFPTSHVKANLSQEHAAEWNAHEETLTELLRLASALGHVAIVTMATSQWIQECTKKHMPSLTGLFHELGIEVVAARSTLSRSARAAAFGECRDPSQFAKTCAMERVARRFYRGRDGMRRAPKSWKNILGIGDSSAERLALQDVVFRHVQRDRLGRSKDCRCKTVMLLDSPSLLKLTAQVQVLIHWLPTLVHHDGDVDLDFASDSLLPMDGQV